MGVNDSKQQEDAAAASRYRVLKMKSAKEKMKLKLSERIAELRSLVRSGASEREINVKAKTVENANAALIRIEASLAMTEEVETTQVANSLLSASGLDNNSVQQTLTVSKRTAAKMLKYQRNVAELSMRNQALTDATEADANLDDNCSFAQEIIRQEEAQMQLELPELPFRAGTRRETRERERLRRGKEALPLSGAAAAKKESVANSEPSSGEDDESPRDPAPRGGGATVLAAPSAPQEPRPVPQREEPEKPRKQAGQGKKAEGSKKEPPTEVARADKKTRRKPKKVFNQGNELAGNS